MLAGLPQIMRMRFAYVLTGCVTASAGILTATDEPISHFSIPEWNWSALIHSLVLSVSRELTNGIVYNLATECCLKQQSKEEPNSHFQLREEKSPYFSIFMCNSFLGKKKKKGFWHALNIHVWCEVPLRHNIFTWNQSPSHTKPTWAHLKCGRVLLPLSYHLFVPFKTLSLSCLYSTELSQYTLFLWLTDTVTARHPECDTATTPASTEVPPSYSGQL